MDYAALRRAMGLPDGADLAEAILHLNQALGIPKTLAEMGMPREVVPIMVERSLADHSTATNARPVSARDYAQLFDAAFAG